ncbi:MAG: hypothetical protein J0M34_03905 [Alphaproteobacteria bacterium]|nr:hypothetical protein [Alphaproteobacteria bacterium]
MKRLLLLLPLLLCACIVVDDFGDAWKKAEGDICLNRINAALYAQVHEREVKEDRIEKLARGITLDGHHYILMKENPSDKGGFLFRFTVKEGVFTRYKLNPTMRKQFLEEYPNAPVSIDDSTATLTSLDTERVALLNKIADDAKYWETDDRTLYNPLRNKLCRFEDRDLETLED